MTKSETMELRKEWRLRVNAFLASGQKAGAWCAVHNLKLHQLKYWLGQQKKMAVPAVKSPVKSMQWLPVEVIGMETTRERKPLLIKVGKATIEVSSGFDPDLLADAVQALTRAC